MDSIAFIGGTGRQGLGLALRFAAAGAPVVIGSRVAERATAAAETIRVAVPGASSSPSRSRGSPPSSPQHARRWPGSS